MSLARLNSISKAWKHRRNVTRRIENQAMPTVQYGTVGELFNSEEQLTTREEYDREIRRDDLREARIEADRE